MSSHTASNQQGEGIWEIRKGCMCDMGRSICVTREGIYGYRIETL